MRYPVKGPTYDGQDSKKLAEAREEFRIAEKVAAFINVEASKLAIGDRHNVLSHQVARVIEEDSEIVRRIIMRYQGGAHGMFIDG